MSARDLPDWSILVEIQKIRPRKTSMFKSEVVELPSYEWVTVLVFEGEGVMKILNIYAKAEDVLIDVYADDNLVCEWAMYTVNYASDIGEVFKWKQIKRDTTNNEYMIEWHEEIPFQERVEVLLNNQTDAPVKAEVTALFEVNVD